MPMGDVPSRAHQELDPEERLLVICHHGVRSMNVTVWLRNQGFEQAQSVRGGIDAWSREVDPAVAALLASRLSSRVADAAAVFASGKPRSAFAVYTLFCLQLKGASYVFFGG